MIPTRWQCYLYGGIDNCNCYQMVMPVQLSLKLLLFPTGGKAGFNKGKSKTVQNGFYWGDNYLNAYQVETTTTLLRLRLLQCLLGGAAASTSNGGCRREEKSHKHWSLFTIFGHWNFIRSNQKQLYVLTALKIREK